MTWVNTLLQGVLLGGFYALLACGLSLMFGVMRIINLAHGDIAVVGAYLIWVIVNQTSISPFLAALIVLPVMWVAGYAMYILLLERSRRAGVLVPLLTTFGLAIVIENVLLQVFSPDVHSLGSTTGGLATASATIRRAVDPSPGHAHLRDCRRGARRAPAVPVPHQRGS